MRGVGDQVIHAMKSCFQGSNLHFLPLRRNTRRETVSINGEFNGNICIYYLEGYCPFLHGREKNGKNCSLHNSDHNPQGNDKREGFMTRQELIDAAEASGLSQYEIEYSFSDFSISYGC